MTTITKKQASIALVVIAFAAVMIAGTIASVADNSAFAHRGHWHHGHHHHFGHHNHGSHSSINQSISQHSSQHQHSTVLTAGANSPVFNSGNNFASSVNANSGGNAAANN